MIFPMLNSVPLIERDQEKQGYCCPNGKGRPLRWSVVGFIHRAHLLMSAHASSCPQWVESGHWMAAARQESKACERSNLMAPAGVHRRIYGAPWLSRWATENQ